MKSSVTVNGVPGLTVTLLYPPAGAFTNDQGPDSAMLLITSGEMPVSAICTACWLCVAFGTVWSRF